jgi:AraC-like DNA-binding protein
MTADADEDSVVFDDVLVVRRKARLSFFANHAMSSNPRESLQRVGPLAVVPAVLREFGVDPGPVFAGLGLSAGSMQRDAWLPYGTLLAVLERSAEAAGRTEFGLRVGLANDHRCLGMVGELMSSAATLGQALRDYVSVQGRLSSGGSAYLIPIDDCVAFGYGIYDRFTPAALQAYGVYIGAALRILPLLSGGAAHPVEVRFSGRMPPDGRSFERLAGVPVRFNERQTCVLLRRRDLTAPNPSADHAARQRLLTEVAGRLGTDLQSVAARLRHALRPALSLGETSLRELARGLGLSTRTLDRRLAAEGTSFQHERDAIRSVMAEELLALTDLNVGEVANALFYANHSAFVRSFRRWSGVTPSAWRHAQRGRAPKP